MKHPINLKFSAKSIFYYLCFVLLITMVVMSLDSGISGDEYFEEDQAEYIFDYYKTFGKDTTAINPPYTLEKYYGQSFSTIAYTINNWFNIDSIYESRHVLNAINGWLLILFSGLIASLLFGWRAGIITLLFVFFSPKILGHSWNNPKDIPFASSYIFAIYFLLHFIKTLPKINYKSLLLFSLGVAWMISLRIGGLILIPYAFLFIGSYYLATKSFYTKLGFLGALKVTGLTLAAIVLGYFLGLILWPFALHDPINNPLEALTEMTNYSVGLNQIFEGKIQVSKDLPWFYGIKYILISSPIIVFLGFLLFLGTVWFRKNTKNNYLFYSFLLFAFAFPIAYTVYKGSNLYGGWRHLLWTYPPLVILASGGFEYFIGKQNKYIKYGTVAVIAILLFHPVKHTFKNHPLQYIYYNQLVGGVKGAYGNYEMDYYYHSLRDGAEWLIENKVGKDSIIVATNHTRITEYFFRHYPQVKVTYCRYYEKSKHEWDYAIWANTHITPLQLKKGYWPPQKAIYTMDVDECPVGAVIERVSDEDLKGFATMKKGKTKEAKIHFKNALALNPQNEEVLEGYASVMMRERNYDSTIIYADSALFFNPRQIGSMMLKASVYNAQKNYKEANLMSDQVIALMEQFAEAHFQKGFALKNLKQPNEALKEFQKAASLKKNYYQAHIQMGEILINYKQYKKALAIFDKVFKFKEKDVFSTTQSAKCQHFLNDNIKAEKLIKTLTARSQNNLEAVKVRSRIAMSNNDMNKAGQLINMARNFKNNADLWVVRALFVLKQKNKVLAKQYLDKALEIDPLNREAETIVKSLQAKKTEVGKTQQQKPKKQQSIMFQKAKPKPKKANPFLVPVK